MMKKYITSLILLTCTIGLIWSCSKKTENIALVTPTDGYAFIKFGQYSPNFRSIVNGRDSFNIYVNEKKINGAFLTFNSIFPGATNLYAAVPSGNQTIRMTVNGVTTPDSVTLFAYSKNLVAGKYYSLFITDSMTSVSESKQMFLSDNFARTDTLHYTIRLVHTIFNDLGGNIDIYSNRLAANIFSNVSPGTTTPFSTQPYSLALDTLILRRAGTLTELTRINGAVLARERAYTLVYKGNSTVTTGTKARALSLFFNQ